jgi:hypothetical protein
VNPDRRDPAFVLAPADLACSQCGQPLPSDPAGIEAWRDGPRVRAGELDAGLLLCPDCDAEEHGREFEEGAGG